MRFSVIVPACSRPDPKDPDGEPDPYLWSALSSISDGRKPTSSQDLLPDSPDVEILIGVDGHRPKVVDSIMDWCVEHADEMFYSHEEVAPEWSGLRVRLWKDLEFSGTYGNQQRNIMLPHAMGDLLHHTDTDDAVFPDAYRMVAKVAQRNPGRPIVGRMRIHCYGSHTQPMESPDVLWKTKGLLAVGHIGGHCLVAPNKQELLARWMPEARYEADFNFVSETIQRFRAVGLEEVWDKGFLAMTRPWSAGIDYKKG